MKETSGQVKSLMYKLILCDVIVTKKKSRIFSGREMWMYKCSYDAWDTSRDLFILGKDLPRIFYPLVTSIFLFLVVFFFVFSFRFIIYTCNTNWYDWPSIIKRNSEPPRNVLFVIIIIGLFTSPAPTFWWFKLLLYMKDNTLVSLWNGMYTGLANVVTQWKILKGKKNTNTETNLYANSKGDRRCNRWTSGLHGVFLIMREMRRFFKYVLFENLLW